MRCTCMTLIGGIGFLAYATYWATDPLATAVQTNDRIDNHTIITSPADASAMPRTEAPAIAAEPETIGEGSTREQVVALWGNPTAINESNDRWTYGRTVVIFKDDQVAGVLTLTSKQLSNLNSVRPASKSVARKAVDNNAKRASAKSTATCRRAAPTAYPFAQSLPGGYAPYARSARSGQNFWAPMYRPFYSNQPLPRSQSHVSRGWSGNSMDSQSYYQRPFRR